MINPTNGEYFMKKIITVAALLIIMITTQAAAEITGWWGIISFRERQEVEDEYYSDVRTAKFGELKDTESNTMTRVGYQFGFRINMKENIFAGLTFRSGLGGIRGDVMWQDIDNRSGLSPSIQEAYIDWTSPYTRIQMGKIPQNGNALWDLYAAHKYTDLRADDPRDGIFNDRMAALDGARLLAPVGPVTLRGTFNIDYAGGFFRENKDTQSGDEYKPDKMTYLLGAEINLTEFAAPFIPELKKIEIDGDYGFPYRASYPLKSGKDSTYADEDLWGLNFAAEAAMLEIQFGYAYNWRDSVYTSQFWDLKTAGNFRGFKLTGRYQHQNQKHEIGIYDGHEVIREAFHLYLNKEVWNLDLQPRWIWFKTTVDDTKVTVKNRYELTATVRF